MVADSIVASCCTPGARREVRRRPGRTLLVALLVAIPVLAMAFGSIAVRSGGEEAAYARSYGASDFAIEQYSYVDEGGALSGTGDRRRSSGRHAARRAPSRPMS